MTWADDMNAVHKEAGGLMSIEVIRPVDAPELLGRAMISDPHALRITQALIAALEQINAAPRRSPMLCGSCPRPLRKANYAIVIAAPEREDVTRCVSLAICTKCATEPNAIKLKALEALRRIWPDARPIMMATPHTAGHA